MFAKPLVEKIITLNAKLGVGAQHLVVGDGFALVEDRTTEIEYQQLESTTEAGGVVNIIMRDDYDGAEIEIGGEWPTRKGADSDHVNFTFGTSNDKGHVLFSGEWFKRNPIFDADRSYSQVQVNPGPGGGWLRRVRRPRRR